MQNTEGLKKHYHTPKIAELGTRERTFETRFLVPNVFRLYGELRLFWWEPV